MIRLHTLAASTVLTALTLLPVSAPRADFSISFSTGFSQGYGNSHRHGNSHHHRGFRQRHHDHRNHHRDYRDRWHSRPHGSRIIIKPHAYRAPGRYVPGTGCRPVTERTRDRFGRLVLLQRTLCYDRHGRPFVLGGPRAYRH